MAAQPARTIVRVVLIVVAVAIALYLLFLLRKPIGWLLIAVYLAIALSGPVNFLGRRMPRAAAIALTYLGLLSLPVLLGALFVPPVVSGISELAANAPQYAKDVADFVSTNPTLRGLNEDYGLTQRLEEAASDLPSRLGDAAAALSSVGAGLINSAFALITILILTAFMLGSGRHWMGAALRQLPRDRAERLRRVLERSTAAVGNYVAGALFQATVAGILSYLVLTILGVPFAGPLAVLIFFLDLIPLVGATLGAVLVAVVTLFHNFPTATIVWVIWSVVYQQVENNLIQPQIQKRAVNVHPFVVVVAVLFGAELLGVIGALVAVPIAASIQIALREYAVVRRMLRGEEEPPPEGPAPTRPEPEPAGG